MNKRTTPKIFRRAKELHRNLTEAETKLWAHLRAHRMGDVRFRNQHAIGNYIVDFCAPRKNSSLSWMAVSILSENLTTSNELLFFHLGDVAFCASGTMM
jgi:hypothetical protein